MSALPHAAGFPPSNVTALLRIEGVAVLAATLAAYQLTGGDWGLFALLFLMPDLAMLGFIAGRKTGSVTYNLAHTYAVPLALGSIGWAAGVPFLLAVALIWIAHIGMDRALGYGLRYASVDQATHLGWIGKARGQAAGIADPR